MPSLEDSTRRNARSIDLTRGQPIRIETRNQVEPKRQIPQRRSRNPQPKTPLADLLGQLESDDPKQQLSAAADLKWHIHDDSAYRALLLQAEKLCAANNQRLLLKRVILSLADRAGEQETRNLLLRAFVYGGFHPSLSALEILQTQLNDLVVRQAFLRAAADPVMPVRSRVISALGSQHEDADVRKLLLSCLKEDDVDVLVASLQALKPWAQEEIVRQAVRELAIAGNSEAVRGAIWRILDPLTYGSIMLIRAVFGEQATPQIPVDLNQQTARIFVDRVRDLLTDLSERERRFIQLQFGLLDGQQRTVEEIASEFQITRERTRQIEAKILRKLRHQHFDASKLQAYFSEE